MAPTAIYTLSLHDALPILEAAWAYQHRPWVGEALLQRQQGLDQAIKDIAWKAQCRLHTRYQKLAARGKNKNQIVTAVGREDRKSTRLNSSHANISYAVFCL